MKATTKHGLVKILDTHDIPSGIMYLVQYANGNTSPFWIFSEFLTFEIDNDSSRIQSTKRRANDGRYNQVSPSGSEHP